NGCVSISFSRLLEKCNAFGTAMAELGLMGKTVAVVGETSPEYIVSYFCTVMGGGRIVPLDKELSDEETIHFLKRADASALVYSSTFTDRAKRVEEQLSEVKHLIRTTVPGKDEVPVQEDEKNHNFDDLVLEGALALRKGNRAFVSHVPNMNTEAALLFTSGTTGTAKGVVLTLGNLIAAVNASAQVADFCPEDRLLSVLPIHHTYEMTCGIMGAMVYGTTICINDSLKHLLKNFQLFKPNSLALVPLFVNTMYKKIWETAAKNGQENILRLAVTLNKGLRKIRLDANKLLFKQVVDAFGGKLEKIICGGAALSPKIIEDFEVFGIKIGQGYGITECAPLISLNPFYSKKRASVGRPVPGMEAYIDSPDASGIGEITVRGPNVMKGYLHDPLATAAVKTFDGWFFTGDLGYIDDEGYIFITGRKKNVIVLNNGKNVFPEEIEDHLDRIDLIAESVVVGRVDANGEVSGLTAIIFPHFEYAASKGITEYNALAAAVKKEIFDLNKKLPSYKQIRNVELRKTEFEKTTSRKIKRYKIH
ncbi:MAG TPA: AMP-dependent synthetase, partial [Clostridiales bacterium]|nr:AMP-dependent synthetase [Clostridiales bacterium]